MLGAGMFSLTNAFASASSGTKRRGSLPDRNLSPAAAPVPSTSRRGSMFVPFSHVKLVSKHEERKQQQQEHNEGKPAASRLKRRQSNRRETMTDTTPPIEIEVHGYSNDPTEAWQWLKTSNPVMQMKPMDTSTPIYDDRVRFVCISDTHGRIPAGNQVPPGDVLLVAGDFTTCGHPQEIKSFNQFLGRLPHSYKVVVCGNHELTFDQSWVPARSIFPIIEKFLEPSENSRVDAVKSVFSEALRQENVANPRQLLTNCILLEDEMVTLFGLKLYGSPWIPKFDNWAYNLSRGQEILSKWNCIPANTDILITHTPPLGYCDLTLTDDRAGCVELLTTVRKRVRPKYHVFGHIHESYGCMTDGHTKFINSSFLDAKMKPVNEPLIFDVSLQSDKSKAFFVRSK